MNWKDVLRAMAFDASRRAENSKVSPGGPSDPYSVGRAEGAAYAFNVMAQEMRYLADETYNSRESLVWLRKLLDGATAKAVRR